MQPDAASPDPPPTGVALHEAKRALRTQVIGARDALDPDYRARASLGIVARLRALPSFASARAVLVTLPFGSEWDTRSLASAALESGKLLVVPRVNSRTRMLELHAISDIAGQISLGYRGIPEPLPDRPRVEATDIDWVLVPGVAFSRDGFRLGYGGGYYDRLMSTMSPAAPRVAGAFDIQVVPRIPAASHDLCVDQIVTETLVLTAAARR
ncbi:MAG TPA: 5-formyltetrahydrofolate cyclo-ligase [Casimicrobiaceae bacterium]|nr:5-formyltetrahydrofolate cyclo-ligase [Casimicrobiaceae bacterium]